ncbi:MAG: trans-sulfuration enzyme family protein [Tenacibaculum sp.]
MKKDTKSNLGINTICTHVGELKDQQFKGSISPLFMATSYQFDQIYPKRYPRYFNTPNQEALCKKIAALEKTSSALIFGSGMAAISTSLLAFLQKGTHVVLQETLYGGTYSFVIKELKKFGIDYSFTKGMEVEDFNREIKKNTKVIFIETPSNPLLKLVDIKKVATLAKQRGVISMIDNTFASPINQTPADFGIDIVLHSATKYLGGHSDILAGAVATSKKYIEQIASLAINLGGSLSDFTVWMLERSLKTLNLRVKCQSKNALKMAKYLENNEYVNRVYYPGLESHSHYTLAKSQMNYFGGMLSFELIDSLDAMTFMRNLQLIKPSMSLAGVESTVLSPAQTSHALLTKQAREEQDIKDGLIRFSVGIEETKDLIQDIEQALNKTLK